MIDPTLTQIWTKLVKIERMLELARLRHIVERDFDKAGHLMPGTAEEIERSGFKMIGSNVVVKGPLEEMEPL